MTPPAPTTLEAALRLALAFLLGLPLGWVREGRSRSAGLRTYPLLSLCACSFLLVARTAAEGPSALADAFYGLITGIGFVGSGALVKSPEQRADDGMASLVSLWLTGAIGAGVAYGSPLISVAVSSLSLLTLWGPGSSRGSRRETS